MAEKAIIQESGYSTSLGTPERVPRGTVTTGVARRTVSTPPRTVQPSNNTTVPKSPTAIAVPPSIEVSGQGAEIGGVVGPSVPRNTVKEEIIQAGQTVGQSTFNGLVDGINSVISGIFGTPAPEENPYTENQGINKYLVPGLLAAGILFILLKRK